MKQILFLLVLLLSAMSCQTEHPPLSYAGEYARLITYAELSPQYLNYQANFHAEKRVFDFIGKSGPYQDSIWVIMDGNKYVALYFAQDKPYLDIFATRPELALNTLKLPVRHHNATLLGTRLSTSAWYDKWALSGDIHDRKFEGSGDAISLVETQLWKPSGSYQREAKSIHRFTFKVDPYLGYIVEANCQFTTDDSRKPQIELMNFMPRDAVNPWPDAQAYTHTVFTPTKDSSYVSYANNLLAGNLSDETKTDWGKGFEVRQGGFTSMLSKGTYSPTLFRWGNVRFVHRTCDAWLDLHQHILLPLPDSNDQYHVDATYLFAHLPPQLSDFVLERAQSMPFKRKSGVMIPLGEEESFENQPLSIEHIGIGLTKGFWEKDFLIDSTQAYSGTQSLRIAGKTAAELSKTMEGFIRYPQIPLQPKTNYRLEVMAKTAAPDLKAWLEATTYEWTPYDTTRLARYRTNVAIDTTWQLLSLTFSTPNFDPFVDLRFKAEGKGDVLFDDFYFGPVADRKGN